jgi:hypothetical protein
MDFKGQELFELISWLAAIIMAAIYGIGASQSTSHDPADGVS